MTGLGWTGFGKEKKEEKRELQYIRPYECAGGALPFFGLDNSGSAMSLSAFYRAVDLISSSLAILPIKVFVSNVEGKTTADGHPLNLVFSDRNNKNLITKFTLIKLLAQSVMMRGNGFALIERASDGTVTGLRYIEPKDVIIVYDRVRYVLYYDVPFLNRRVMPEDMLHFKLFSYDGINGISILSNASRSVAIANSAENTSKNFYQHNTFLNGVLTVNGPLSKEQRDDIKQAWNETYTQDGTGIAVLQGNMAFQPIQMSASDSQMLESRKYTVEDIARFFGISPVLLGDLSHASYSTLEAVQQDFLVHCLQPYITMMEDEMSRKLLKPSEGNLSVVFETNEILRTDKQAQSNYYTALINSGVLSINEVRKELGYAEIEDGDKHIIPFSDVAQNTIGNNEEKDLTNNEDNKE